MFGSTKETRTPGGLSVIGADVSITGDVETTGDLHLDGTIQGDVRCGSLVQGPSGRIVGSVRATSARIAGTIEGAIDADAITLQSSARIVGDSRYAALTIETGAQVEGRMSHAVIAAPESPLRLVDASEG